MIDRIVTPLTGVAKQGTMSVALPNNAEGRNGQFRNGGHYQRSGLDAHSSQTSQQSPVFVRCKASGRGSERAICGSRQHNSGDVTRTVQNSTSEKISFVVVLPVASGPVSSQAGQPRCLPRRSIESRPAHCMPYGNIWQGQEQGRVEGISMRPSTYFVLSYFLTLATNALLDRHYAQWQEAQS